MPEESYILSLVPGVGDEGSKVSVSNSHRPVNEIDSGADEPGTLKKSRISLEDSRHTSSEDNAKLVEEAVYESSETAGGSDYSLRSQSPEVTSSMTSDGQNKTVNSICSNYDKHLFAFSFHGELCLDFGGIIEYNFSSLALSSYKGILFLIS